ncbi:transposase [Micromonospora maritima]|uniref:transposase n=1 Tax=Micromonospora maritima TaxID=986711 RepID=UPI00378B28AD
MIDAILYVVRTGCAWRYLLVDFPPWQTVYAHFTRLNDRGVTERILTELREQIRMAHGRQPEPAAGIIDSQSVKGADTVPRATRGYDAGKKINGRLSGRRQLRSAAGVVVPARHTRPASGSASSREDDGSCLEARRSAGKP